MSIFGHFCELNFPLSKLGLILEIDKLGVNLHVSKIWQNLVLWTSPVEVFVWSLCLPIIFTRHGGHPIRHWAVEQSSLSCRWHWSMRLLNWVQPTKMLPVIQQHLPILPFPTKAAHK